MHRFLKLDLSDLDDRNAWYLILEIFWAAVLGAAATFNAAVAVRMGASNTEVSLLTSLPALLAVIVSIPAGRFLRVRRKNKPWILGALTLHRAGYLLVALIPWLPLGDLPVGKAVVAVLIVMTLPVHFFNVGFIPMMAAVIPENRRAGVFTARNVVYNATLSLCTFLFGLWLAHMEPPHNYQSMYGLGFVASLFGLYYLIKVQAPDAPAALPARMNAGRSLRSQLGAFRLALSSYPQFVRITINTFLHGMGLWAATPLLVLRYVKDLKADDAWIGLVATVTSLATITGWALWRSVMARWGEPVTLRRTIVTLGLFPVLAGLLPSLTPILFAAGLNGLMTPGVNLSHFTTLLKVTPEENRQEYTGLYMTLVNLGVFVFPLAGVAAANRFGFAPVLVACGLLSIAGSTSFWWWPVDMATQEAAPVEDTKMGRPQVELEELSLRPYVED